MDDLIALTNKYAKGAGRIQEGQRNAAERDERLSRWLSWVSAALSAAVGTSIFTQWVQKQPIPFGVAAIVAASLSALQRTAKLDERAEAHRVVSAEYGGLRRRAGMLRLRLEGGDVKRELGLVQLELIEKDLSELARKARTLPNSIYKPAVKAFKISHPEYFTEPTHAGGVVIRGEGAALQYLIVQTKKKPHKWVLPKGHIKVGESPEQAARREVLEESGVEAVVREMLDTVEFLAPNGPVKVQFFLMDAIKEGPPREGRERQWLDFDGAIQGLKFIEAQRLICQAHVAIKIRASRV